MVNFLLLLLTGTFAGILGALTGLGGGIIIVPLLTIGFGVPMHFAIGASLISIIGTSSGSAASYVKEGYTNMRIGIFLEVGTTLGAIFGALLAGFLPGNTLGIIFGFILLISMVIKGRKISSHRKDLKKGSIADRLKLYGHYKMDKSEKAINYSAKNVAGGFSLMTLAGALSGLLGIGSGVFKVLAMDDIMKLPFKVSTTTSNFMIGVTATTGALIFFQRGEIIPLLAAPVLIGTIIGSVIGVRLFMKIRTDLLRKIFTAVVFAVSAYMIYNGFKNNFS